MTGLHIDRDGDRVRIKRGPIVLRIPVHEWDLIVRRGNKVARDIQQPAQHPHAGRMDAAQSRHLHALLGEYGARGDDRFPVLSTMLRREITSTNDLSPDEAQRCIDGLMAELSTGGQWGPG